MLVSNDVSHNTTIATIHYFEDYAPQIIFANCLQTHHDSRSHIQRALYIPLNHLILRIPFKFLKNFIHYESVWDSFILLKLKTFC